MIAEPQKPIFLFKYENFYPEVNSRDLLVVPTVQLKTKYTFFLNMKMPQEQNTNCRHKNTQIPNILLAKLIIIPKL